MKEVFLSADVSIYQTLKVYDPDKKIYLLFDRDNYLQECVKGKFVLHVGCSNVPITEERIRSRNLLHIKLQDSAKEVIGILETFGIDNVFVMDAEDMKFTTHFDTILGGDVLEHMSNPGKFLEKASRLLNPNGEIILGVPSALTINNLKCLLGGWEQVHSDHTFYFSPKTLSTLCSRYGLLPTKLIFTVQPMNQLCSWFFEKFY